MRGGSVKYILAGGSITIGAEEIEGRKLLRFCVAEHLGRAWEGPAQMLQRKS